MGFVRVPLLICLVLFVSCAFGLPRDSTAFNNQNNEHVIDEPAPTSKHIEPISVAEVKIPGRIPCQYDEATEDSVCQEHCLPKGYSYGLCVSKICSCI